MRCVDGEMRWVLADENSEATKPAHSGVAAHVVNVAWCSKNWDALGDYFVVRRDRDTMGGQTGGELSRMNLATY